MRQQIKDKKLNRKTENLGPMPFTIVCLPHLLNKLSNEDIDFLKITIKQNGVDFRGYFNKELSLELSCYLSDTNVDITKLSENVIKIIEGIAFKHRRQIKKLDIFIKDIKSDPFNSGSPFIGVVLREIKKLTKEETQEKRAKFNQIMDSLKELGA